MTARVAICLGFRNWIVSHLERCLAAFARGPWPIVVADLGSPPPKLAGVRRAVAAHADRDVRFIRMDQDEWSRSQALNLAATACPEAETLIFTDADMVAPTSWFEAVQAALATPEGRATLWLTDSRDLPQGSVVDLTDAAAVWAATTPHPRVGQGAAMIVPRAWFDEVGGFDETYRVWGCEDNDLVLRAEWSGLPWAWLGPPEGAWVAHQWHDRTWPTAGQHAQVWRNRAYLAERIAAGGPVVRNRAAVGQKA